MEESARIKVLEIIRKSIDEVVYDEMKKMPGRIQARQEEFKKTKSQRAQDAHDALFGNQEDEISYRLKLHESDARPKITTNELSQFENDFKNRFPDIVFDKQNGIGQNGQIVDFPIKNGKKDAVASGKIIIDNEAIGFTMSLSDGLKIKSTIEGGQIRAFEIEPETKDIFAKLLNLYEELFKKRFNEIINPTEDLPNENNIGATGSDAMPPSSEIATPPAV